MIASSSRAVLRVLVVEDEQDVAELIRCNLRKEGYDAIVTSSGADAKTEAQPDLVLLDGPTSP